MKHKYHDNRLIRPKLEEGMYIPLRPVTMAPAPLYILKTYYKEALQVMKHSNINCNKENMLQDYVCSHVNNCDKCLLCFKNIDKLKEYIDSQDEFNKQSKEREKEFLDKAYQKARDIINRS
jgi:hypothetical protein